MTDKKIIIPEGLTVAELAKALDLTVSTVIGELMKNGVMATINDRLDPDTAQIIAAELGFEVETEKEVIEEKAPKKRRANDQGDIRPPVVAVMGHVDHGKTSLLDAIRGSSHAKDEAGGITQHISAYHIDYKGRGITLLDTPGHEAFSSLRQHGAALTDVAIIVVAADDGVKPQTIEAINYAKKAGVQILVAINKTDKPGADVNKTKQQLSEAGLNTEEWGGEIVMVEVSAKTKQGVDKLLEMTLLLADINELKAETNGPAEGIIIESHMATGKGPVATLLIEQGTLALGDFLVAGSTTAKVKSLEDESGKPVQTAGPSRAVEVSGFKSVPSFGDEFKVEASEKAARSAAQTSVDIGKSVRTRQISTASEVLTSLSQQSKHQNLNVIIKTDVQGSLESITSSVVQLGNENIGVKVVSSGVGPINESDISRAKSSGAIILGFHVTMSSTIKRQASRENVQIKLYDVIYELLDEVKGWMEDMLSPEVVETVVAELTIKGVFRSSKSQLICGGDVVSGKLTPGLLARIYVAKSKEPLAEAKVTKVQKAQQEVKEVVSGEQCGVELSTTSKVTIDIGDRIEFFVREEKKRKL